ncbi:hypothetical protein [uncultured Brevundimonas sp.]|uniref:hypothetical protein n=1 Tax=uncultured Brevundimonas sp. TaxID=213418 RepID=UPI0025EF6129|nr:hypothetical protein [uncultured Brevundimonas sp.]
MKNSLRLVHLALAAAMLTSSVVGAATLAATQAEAAERPWLIITYLRNGQNVGNTQVFCNSPDVNFGDTTNYDNTHYDYYFMCP